MPPQANEPVGGGAGPVSALACSGMTSARRIVDEVRRPVATDGRAAAWADGRRLLAEVAAEKMSDEQLACVLDCDDRGDALREADRRLTSALCDRDGPRVPHRALRAARIAVALSDNERVEFVVECLVDAEVLPPRTPVPSRAVVATRAKKLLEEMVCEHEQDARRRLVLPERSSPFGPTTMGMLASRAWWQATRHETFAAFTGDPTAAQRLARFLQLPEGRALVPGDEVVMAQALVEAAANHDNERQAVRRALSD